MTDDQIYAVIINLETKVEGIVQKEIKHGMELLSAQMSSSCAKNIQSTMITLARIEENVAKKDKEITQIFTMINKIKDEDKRQEAMLASSSGAMSQADKMKTLWMSAAGVVIAIIAFVWGKK